MDVKSFGLTEQQREYYDRHPEMGKQYGRTPAPDYAGTKEMERSPDQEWYWQSGFTDDNGEAHEAGWNPWHDPGEVTGVFGPGGHVIATTTVGGVETKTNPTKENQGFKDFTPEKPAPEPEAPKGRDYKPGETMYELGFRNEGEYTGAASRRGLGPHEGSAIPEGTILITDAGGKLIERIRADEIRPSDITIGQEIAKDRFRIPVKDYEGHEVLLTKQEADKLSAATGRTQFELYQAKDIIPKDSEFVPGENGEWAYQPTGSYQKGRESKQEAAVFEYNNVKLQSGQWVNKAEYNKLSDFDKNLLDKQGVVSFNFNKQVQSIIGNSATYIYASLMSRPGAGEFKEYLEAVGKPETLPAFVAEHTVPFYRTAKHWDQMDTLGKAINLTIDTAIVLPIVYQSVKDWQAARNPVQTATESFLKQEAKAAKNMGNLLKKEYGNEVADSFNNMNKVQKAYAIALAKLEDAKLRGKDIEEIINSSRNAENAYKDSISRYLESLKGQPGYDSPVIRNVLNGMPNDSPRNLQGIVQGLIPDKQRLMILQKEASAAENTLKSAQEKWPTEPNKWTDLMVDAANKKMQLEQSRGTNIQQLVKEIAEGKTIYNRANLETKQALKIALADKQKELDALTNAMETDLKLESYIGAGGERKYRIIEPMGGGTGVAIKTAPAIGLSGSSTVKELTKTTPLPFLSAVTPTKFNLQKPPQISEFTRVAPSEQPIISPSMPPEIKRLTVENPALIPGINAAFDAGIEAANAAQASNLSATETQQKVETAVKQAITTQVETSLQPKLQTRVGTITKVAIQTINPPKPFDSVPPLLIKEKKAESEEVQKEYEGAVAWKQGELNDKPVMNLLKLPYKKQSDLETFVGKVPAGAIVVKGKGSVQSSVRLIKGEGPKNVNIDVGAQDLNITTKNKRVIVRFKPDPKGKTTNPISVGGRPPRMRTTVQTPYRSQKRGKIFRTKVGNGTLLSRHPIGRQRGR